MHKAQVSVAIIGSGIAGCATAFSLAQRGLKVTVFERNTSSASEASGNPIAMLYPRLSGDNSQSDYALLAYQYSLKFYQSLTLNHDNLQQCGMLQLGFNPRERHRIEKVAASLPADLAQLVSAKEASRIANIQCQHPALYFSQAGWLKPKAVCDKLLKHANINCQYAQDIRSITQHNGKYCVSSHDQQYDFDAIVICNANDANQLPQTAHLEHHAVRGQLTQLRSTMISAPLATIICSDGFISPAIAGQHICGATFAPNDTQAAVTDTDHQQNIDKLKTISKPLHQALNAHITSGRTAFRCVSQDRLPIVGQLIDAPTLRAAPVRPNAAPDTLPWLSGLYVNIAHGSHGFTSAPFAADMLAHLISQQPLKPSHQIFSHLNPNRFLLKAMGLKKLARSLATDKLF